jgi:predicted Holliday junction resolvase-like endonuclease
LVGFISSILIHVLQKIDKDVDPLKEKVQQASRDYEEAVKSWRIVEEKASSEEHEVSRLSERLDEFNTQISR